MIYKNTEVSYLGHRLSSEGIKPCEEKIKAIQQMLMMRQEYEEY